MLLRAEDATEPLFHLPPRRDRCRAACAQAGDSRIEEQLAAALDERVDRPFQIDADYDPRDILVSIETRDGVMQVAVPRKRLFTPDDLHLRAVDGRLVAGAAGVASLFMRNQVRALRRLAAAAESFGKGRDVPEFKLEGATEVRQAAARLPQDARPHPAPDHPAHRDAGRGVARSAHAADAHAARARVARPGGAGGRRAQGRRDRSWSAWCRAISTSPAAKGPKQPRDTDVGAAHRGGRGGGAARRRRRSRWRCRRITCCRCVPTRCGAASPICISNARRYGSHVWVTALPVARRRSTSSSTMTGRASRRRSARTSSARSSASTPRATRRPAASGLGLTIARDVARGHGGELTLEESPQGGLRVRLHLPQ